MAHAIAPFGVVNTYATLEDLKQRLAISSGTSTYDDALWKLLHLASRIVDRRCGRRFFVMLATRRFDVQDIAGFPVTDLIQVTQMAEDRDGDGVYESLRHTDSYTLYPLDSEPESAHGTGYRRVMCANEDATDGFALGNSRVKVTGLWGYRGHWITAGASVRNDVTVSKADKSFFVDDDSSLAAGQTIMLGREQLFVRQVAARAVGVVRAINGTTAAVHAAGTPIKVLAHPAEVAEATLVTAVDRWLKRDGYAGGATDNGRALVTQSKELDELLGGYIRLGF